MKVIATETLVKSVNTCDKRSAGKTVHVPRHPGTVTAIGEHGETIYLDHTTTDSRQ
jgi:hypothetical protein